MNRLLLPALLCSISLPQLVTAQSEWRTDFSKHTIPLDEIVSGGPPKDGIPAIDEPRFVTARAASGWLDEREPVIVISVGSVTRVYPYQILLYHEIVNDEIAGVPLTVTYCPLCNTAIVFDRRHNSTILDFGTTGRLRHSDMVMYDRQTESWWQQITGEGLVGEYAGDVLNRVPSQTLRWADARERFPSAMVLSRSTGHRRPYGTTPYSGYDRGTRPYRGFFNREVDNRLPAMERVAAIDLDGVAVAWPFTALNSLKVMGGEVAGKPVVVFYDPTAGSALDTKGLGQSRTVGSSGVFRSRVGDTTLTFEPFADRQFRDRETGTTWDFTGRAIAGELVGRQLEQLSHVDAFWFAWAAFRPDTEIRR
jgi:hypothetical protein